MYINGEKVYGMVVSFLSGRLSSIHPVRAALVTRSAAWEIWLAAELIEDDGLDTGKRIELIKVISEAGIEPIWTERLIRNGMKSLFDDVRLASVVAASKLSPNRRHAISFAMQWMSRDSQRTKDAVSDFIENNRSFAGGAVLPAFRNPDLDTERGCHL